MSNYFIPQSGTMYFSGSDIKFSLISTPNSKDELKPSKIIFSGIVTICFWEDNTKIVVKCVDEDNYDREVAVAMCIAYKLFGSKNQLKKFVKQGYVQVEKETK